MTALQPAEVSNDRSGKIRYPGVEGCYVYREPLGDRVQSGIVMHYEKFCGCRNPDKKGFEIWS